MQLSLPLTARPIGFQLPRQLIHWIICWIIMPNAPFWLLWIIGGPPRHPEILAAGAVGLIVRKASFPVKYATFVAALVYSVLSFIAGLFNLEITQLIESIRFLVEMKPSASTEYVVVAVGLIATLGAAYRLLRLDTAFTLNVHLLMAGLCVFGAANLDKWMSFGMRGAYKRVAPEGAPFSSATQQTGFASLASSGRNLLIVIVEAKGFPNDPGLQRKLLERWKRPDISQRYSIENGITPYYGSTTNGEIRELCGRWGNYGPLKETVDQGCLPNRLAARGYETTALHSFVGTFFDRLTWYPNIGFRSAWFAEELVKRGAAGCAGVFPGACDRDVPKIIAQQLKKTDKPQFVYWLTVNSHLPVPADPSLKTDDCAKSDPAYAHLSAMTCRLFALWEDVDQSLAEVLSDPTLPPTDVLIVGDHSPPFFDRKQRLQFDMEHVPWVLLKHREIAPAHLVAKKDAKPVTA